MHPYFKTGYNTFMMAIAIFGTLTVIVGTVLFLVLKANKPEEHHEE